MGPIAVNISQCQLMFHEWVLVGPIHAQVGAVFRAIHKKPTTPAQKHGKPDNAPIRVFAVDIYGQTGAVMQCVRLKPHGITRIPHGPYEVDEIIIRTEMCACGRLFYAEFRHIRHVMQMIPRIQRTRGFNWRSISLQNHDMRMPIEEGNHLIRNGILHHSALVEYFGGQRPKPPIVFLHHWHTRDMNGIKMIEEQRAPFFCFFVKKAGVLGLVKASEQRR